MRGPAFTLRFVFTEQRLRGAAFTHRSFDAERPLHREAFTHKGFRKLYTQKLYTEQRLNRASFLHRIDTHTHKSFRYTQSFYTQTLVRIEAWSQSLQTKGLPQRSLYTEQLLHQTLLHRDAQSSFCTQTPPGFYAHKFLHISFTLTSFYTEKPLHRASFLHRSIYTHKKALHTQKLYTDAFTHRRFYA